jgi:hypothetical protein
MDPSVENLSESKSVIRVQGRDKGDCADGGVIICFGVMFSTFGNEEWARLCGNRFEISCENEYLLKNITKFCRSYWELFSIPTKGPEKRPPPSLAQQTTRSRTSEGRKRHLRLSCTNTACEVVPF